MSDGVPFRPTLAANVLTLLFARCGTVESVHEADRQQPHKKISTSNTREVDYCISQFDCSISFQLLRDRSISLLNFIPIVNHITQTV
jgi:hypothetical protein